MVYNIKYPTEWKNGVLIACNECKLKIFDNLENGRNIEINSKYRICAHKYIINTLHTSFSDYYDYPQKTKKAVTDLLIKHGQLTLDEIENIYKNIEQDTDYTKEWVENLHTKGFTDEDIFTYFHDDKSNNCQFDEPISYLWPSFPCYSLMKCGLCYQIKEEIRCSSCNCIVLNSPENVDDFNNLLCPSCKKPVIRSGVPYKDGEWINGKIHIKNTDTDYIRLYHPNCPKSDNEYGSMYPIGIRVEKRNLIIHLKCELCGYEDVIKIIVKDQSIIDNVYTSDPSRKFNKLQEIKYRTYKLLEETETKILEFKSSFYGINNITTPTPESVKRAKKQIIDEIMAFLNSKGGVLLIGVEKGNTICGIEHDFNYIRDTKKGFLLPPDYLLLEIKDLILSSILNFQKALPNINVSLENLPTGECVCIIDINESNYPIFDKEKNIIINAGGAKQKLSGLPAEEYILEKFGLNININKI